MKTLIGEKLIERKVLLESDIADCVSRFVNGFRVETGLTPDEICIELIDITAIGDRKIRKTVGGCRVIISI